MPLYYATLHRWGRAKFSLSSIVKFRSIQAGWKRIYMLMCEMTKGFSMYLSIHSFSSGRSRERLSDLGDLMSSAGKGENVDIALWFTMTVTRFAETAEKSTTTYNTEKCLSASRKFSPIIKPHSIMPAQLFLHCVFVYVSRESGENSMCDLADLGKIVTPDLTSALERKFA